MKVILYRFNAPVKKLESEAVVSIDAGANVLTVTTISGAAYVGYHIKFEF